MDYEALGRRVRQQRLNAGLTQDELARKVGISCSFVGHIERGEKKASIETVVALCNALKISPTVLLQDSLSSEVMDGQLRQLGDDQALMASLMHVLREHRDREKGGYDS